MSIVSVQIGQCGNQVGSSFFSTLADECSAPSSSKDLRSEALETFFRPRNDARAAQSDSPPSTSSSSHYARCVLVDMEPKVVQSSVRHARQKGGFWEFDPRRTFSRQSGSGNNWAAGYCTHGPNNMDSIMELIRREAEHCDHLGGFFMLQSMAGGTGSGLGTRVAEALRDSYPSSLLLNQCVWPYDSGEVIVQGYNTSLSMAHLSDVSDAVLVVENEALHRTCSKALGMQRPSFNDMNQVLARSLASAFLPSTHAPPPPPAAVPHPRPLRMLRDMIDHLAPHPAYKILSIKSVPQVPPKSADFTTFKWEATLKRVRQMMMTGAASEEGLNWYMTPGRKGMVRTLSALLTLRGPGAASADVAPFLDPQLYTDWSPEPFMWSYNASPFSKQEASASLLSNDASVAPLLARVARRTHSMLAAGAHVHLYEREGVGGGDVEEAVMKVEDLAARYAAL